jgi:hypothetical protein
MRKFRLLRLLTPSRAPQDKLEPTLHPKRLTRMSGHIAVLVIPGVLAMLLFMT